ncbi:ferredoxin--NADP reductase [Roseivirga thermotolerans]|uniref:ferredoxin--NADP reductase n=1 Tax=Roseivirga thermotolerans TaxID=1758176 RepID=UPI00273E994B|nr:ferredoxin--NADP reductase [Roseivirga thermotolerans]
MAFGLFKKTKEKVEKQDTGIIQLTVKEVVRETKEAVSIHFEHPAGGPIEYKAGQFFTIIVEVDGKEERRAYSVCSSPFVDEYPAVAVKRVEGGKVSNYLNEKVKAGDTLKVMKPLGNFTTDFSSTNQRNIVLIGGGSGITPLMSLAKSTLSQEPASRVTLLYANRDEENIIFKKQIEELAKEDQFEVVHVLENNDSGYGQHEGYLSESIIEQVKNELKDESAEYFICGPTPMMDIAVSALSNLGVPQDLIRKESFTSDSKSEATESSSDEVIAREVTIIYDGEEYKYTVQPNETILEKGLDEDIDLPFSCQSGLCTACRGKCLSGKVKMDEDEGLSQAELDEGYVLPCVSHPLTDGVVIEIG